MFLSDSAAFALASPFLKGSGIWSRHTNLQCRQVTVVIVNLFKGHVLCKKKLFSTTEALVKTYTSARKPLVMSQNALIPLLLQPFFFVHFLVRLSVMLSRKLKPSILFGGGCKQRAKDAVSWR